MKPSVFLEIIVYSLVGIVFGFCTIMVNELYAPFDHAEAALRIAAMHDDSDMTIITSGQVVVLNRDEFAVCPRQPHIYRKTEQGI